LGSGAGWVGGTKAMAACGCPHTVLTYAAVLYYDLTCVDVRCNVLYFSRSLTTPTSTHCRVPAKLAAAAAWPAQLVSSPS
jgi:hypothetical protein